MVDLKNVFISLFVSNLEQPAKTTAYDIIAAANTMRFPIISEEVF